MSVVPREAVSKLSMLLSVVAGGMLAGAPFINSLVPFLVLAIVALVLAFFGQRSVKLAYLLVSLPIFIFAGTPSLGLTISKVLIHGEEFSRNYQIYFAAALSLWVVAWCQFRLTKRGSRDGLQPPLH